MFIDRNVVISILVGSILLPKAKSSKQEKPEDCIKGKQYWSKSFLNPSGTCAACMSDWRNCYNEPINDQKRCVDSCRAKPTPKTKPARNSTTLLPSTPMLSPMTSELPEVVPTLSKAVMYPSLAHLNEANKKEKPQPGNSEVKKWPVIAIAVVSVVAFLALLVALVLLVRFRRNRGVAGGNDAEEGVALHDFPQNVGEERLQPNVGEERVNPQDALPPVQATPSTSSLRVGGIQDTEKDKGASSLTLSLMQEIHT